MSDYQTVRSLMGPAETEGRSTVAYAVAKYSPNVKIQGMGMKRSRGSIMEHTIHMTWIWEWSRDEVLLEVPGAGAQKPSDVGQYIQGQTCVLQGT